MKNRQKYPSELTLANLDTFRGCLLRTEGCFDKVAKGGQGGQGGHQGLFREYVFLATLATPPQTDCLKYVEKARQERRFSD